MKKTIYMLPALALMLFAACSSEDAVTTETKAQLNETPDNAIGFGAYINRTTTRAGKPGALTTSGGSTNLQDDGVGFGVFAYYGDGDVYSENALPDFMYNQEVTYNSTPGAWGYTPIKYWPNEFGSSAVSTGVDRVSFFAYAPYVAVTPITGQLTTHYDDSNAEKSSTTGITALSRNGKTGDPYVKYVSAYEDGACVDLCYGVAAEDYTNSVGAGDGRNKIDVGKPFLNVAKPTVDSKIKFQFKHALTQFKVLVDADIDTETHNSGEAVDGLTRIWVRSITFDGIAPRGYLNLKSGVWYDVMDNEKISRGSVTIHDGRRDGQEAQGADTYELTGLNPDLVQSVPYTITPGTENGIDIYTAITTPATTKGVTKTEQNLFSTSDGYILVIPANEQLKATIVYDVETADATLPTYLSDGVIHGSTVENKITKYITLTGGTPFKLEAGKSFTLKLHLGLNSVKFDAEVGDWDGAGTNPEDTWLPSNTLTVAKGEIREVNVPAADISSFTFKVTGLTPGATATIAKSEGSSGTLPSSATVPASGEITVTVETIAANADTSNAKTNTYTVTEGGTTTTVKVIQAKAAP